MKKLICIALIFLFGFGLEMRANSDSLKISNQSIKKVLEIPSKYNIDQFSNISFRVAYPTNDGVMTLRDNPVMYSSKLRSIEFNPTGSSIALMSGSRSIKVISFEERNKTLFRLKDKRKDLKTRKNLPFSIAGKSGERLMNASKKGKIVPVAMCYSADSRHFIVSNSLGEIVIYETRNYEVKDYIQSTSVATMLTMSPNNDFIVAVSGNILDIWNFQTKKLRQNLKFSATITGMVFSPDAMQMAVTTADRVVTILNVQNWNIEHTYTDFSEEILSPSYHIDGKYLSVVQKNKSIVVLNLKKRNIECVLDESDKGISMSHFLKNYNTSKSYILSNRRNSLIFWNASGLNPYFGKLLNSEVDEKMNEWVKMMQGESMDDYLLRVNDETLLQQRNLFEQEVATRLAGDRLAIENPFVEAYDAATSSLSIGFNSMPKIVITVPIDEVDNFGKDCNLTFDNAVYVLNENDEFELAYVEVKNELSNKVYIYDNVGRIKLSLLEDDADFVPLKVLQIAKQEEVLLAEMTEAVVNEKKEEKLITDNTQINVATEVIPGFNADGEKIYNYKIGYHYKVIDEKFSTQEDFPSGSYDIKSSHAAMSLVKIIKTAFEGDFAKYLSEGKVVKINITGSADASPIRGRIAYNGMYGEYINEPYHENGNLSSLTVTQRSGIESNEQLAFMRAAGLKNYLAENISTLFNTQNEYEYYIEVAKERGGEYRRISVEFILIDAFSAQ